jgi:hypothetical protein
MTEAGSAESGVQDFVPHFARSGYVAKGITYFLISFVAVAAAIGNGRAANTRRAMHTLHNGPLGRIVLAAIAVGLAAYALWRFYLAFADPENDRWTKRTGAIFIGAVNLGLAWQAVLLALHQGGTSTEDQAVHWSAVVMRYPAGIWATGVAGVCIAAYGLRQIYKGITAKLDDMLRLHALSHAPRRSVVLAARIGIAARGFVFLLIGFFLVRAAWHSDPSRARDFGDSLTELRDQPYGRWLLLIVAIGLFAYGLYELIRARYRHIPTA